MWMLGDSTCSQLGVAHAVAQVASIGAALLLACLALTMPKLWRGTACSIDTHRTPPHTRRDLTHVFLWHMTHLQRLPSVSATTLGRACRGVSSGALWSPWWPLLSSCQSLSTGSCPAPSPSLALWKWVAEAMWTLITSIVLDAHACWPSSGRPPHLAPPFTGGTPLWVPSLASQLPCCSCCPPSGS